VLAQTPGRLADAEREYGAVLQLDPDSAEAHFNLGNVLVQMPGREPDAVAEYQAALRIRPDLDAAREMIRRLEGSN
jgi:protein O-mannosyl-transferase